MCNQDQLLVFDPKFDSYGHRFEDAARFLLSLAFARHKAAQSGMSWPGDVHSDRLSFFDGYGTLQAEEIKEFETVENCLVFVVWQGHLKRGASVEKCEFYESELVRRGVL